MIRILKKCFFLSIGLHLLVLAGLILWALFMLGKVEKLPPQLSMIAPDILENILNPQPAATRPIVQPPQVQPTPPRPQPQVQPRPPRPQAKPNIRPTPPRPTPKPRPKAQKKSNPRPKPKQRPSIKIAPQTKVNKGSTSARPSPKKPKTPTVTSAQINSIQNMRNNLSGAIQVNMTGANRAAMANYPSLVVAIYRRTWQPLIPKNLAHTRVAKVSVTIRRDGRVLSTRIIRRTGDPALDRSVQRALDRVRTIGKSFPPGAKDAQRTFTLDFTPQIRGGN